MLWLFTTMPCAAVADPARGLANTPLAALGGFIGDWEIDGNWLDGSPGWSRNEFRVGLGGAIVEIRTFTRDGDGEPYERYCTVFAADPETGNLTSYGFTHDGAVTRIDGVRRRRSADGTSVTSEWTSGADELRQIIRVAGGDTYRWKVWIRPGGRGDRAALMDGTWLMAGEDGVAIDAAGRR